MLSGYQCEIIAYVGDGEIICRKCAVAQESSVTIEKLDAGLSACTDLSPLIRYSVDEMSGERQYEWARERARDFSESHPVLADKLGVRDFGASFLTDVRERNLWRLYDRLAEKAPGECCGNCGEELD